MSTVYLHEMRAAMYAKPGARAYPFDPIGAWESLPRQLQEAWDQPPRALLVIRPLGITRHADLLELHVNRK